MALARHWVEPLSKAMEVWAGSGGSLQQSSKTDHMCACRSDCISKNQRLVVSHRIWVDKYRSCTITIFHFSFSSPLFNWMFTRKIWVDKWAPCQSTPRTNCKGGWGGWCGRMHHLVEYLDLPGVPPEDEPWVAMVGCTASKNVGAAEIWHLEWEKLQFQSICFPKPQ